MINIVPDFLDQLTIDFIYQKYENAKGKPLFEINEMGRWQSNLYDGNFAPVYILPLDNDLSPYINPRLSRISAFDNYTISASFLHVWQPGSGINWHHDSIGDNHRIGLTVYLNPGWNVNWGGLFLWEKDMQTGWVCPQYNYAVWLHSPLWHSVSIISKAATTPRLSLQLFLEKK